MTMQKTFRNMLHMHDNELILENDESNLLTINSLKTQFQNNSDVEALEILHILLEALKRYCKDNNRKFLNDALVNLLTEKENVEDLSNPVIKDIFNSIPLETLKKLEKLSAYLRSKLNSLSSKLPEHKYNVQELILPKNNQIEKHFFEPIKKHNKNHTQIVPENSKSDAENYLTWLKECYNRYNITATGLSCEEFVKSVIELITSKTNANELQSAFIEMLGFDLFELIIEILDKKEAILKILDSMRVFLSVENNMLIKEHKDMPVELQELKRLVTKILKSNPNFKANEKSNNKANDKSNSKDRQIFQRHAPNINKNPNIHDERLDIQTKIMICNKTTTVPVDAILKSNEVYEEITLPPRQSTTSVDNIKKVEIKSLDAVGKLVFKDITAFNYIQSEVFNIAYKTNENMLVCAPTGSGKTNIALMTIVNQVKKCIENGILHLERFKVVYICPMKALAAEMANNFSKKLSVLGIKVKELTGDMQLTRREIVETQMLVSTPEKWDVISRKGTADTELTSLVKLIIIDEVHLLNTDRGPVIEALVARTLRQVISSQNMIRIIGLSATLPSYNDVAQFLRVNPDVGLFYFDNRYRSVPLKQTFIGLKNTKIPQVQMDLDEVAFEKTLEFLREGHQVLIFVHARNQTARTANYFKETAVNRKLLDLFQPSSLAKAKASSSKTKSVMKLVDELLTYGIGIHHAGMLRRDRSTTEKHFISGDIKVLVCTATLAWGVNLPAHGVIIKGTEIYDTKRGTFVDLDILNVLQIFGRAGRPQFDTSGHGIIITTSEKINYYLSALMNELPIESTLLRVLPENLNAEIVLGTISNVQEAVEWLTFTYLYKRMQSNPHVYGLLPKDLQEDPSLRGHLLDFCHTSAKRLDIAHMVRYDVASGELMSTSLGRTASYFYLTLETIENFNEKTGDVMIDTDILALMCCASEFQDMQIRPDEEDELKELRIKYCKYPIPPGLTTASRKVNTLMQTYLSRGGIKTFSLAADMEYINQNCVRIARALFDIAMHQNKATNAANSLLVAQAFEQQMWPHYSPLRQFPEIPMSVIQFIEEKNIKLEDLKDTDTVDLGYAVRNHRIKHQLKRFIDSFPTVNIESTLNPISLRILRLKLYITPTFEWNDRIHGKACENFWLSVEEADEDVIYHSESMVLTKAVCMKKETLELIVTIPLVSTSANNYLVRITSDKWMHASYTHALSFKDVHIPSSFTPYTNLLELRPLSTDALKSPLYSGLYKFSHFNPVQTQIFHTLYHTDNNVLVGAPTGSGKTVTAEICILRLLNHKKNMKTVYIAPLKALVRERVDDWKTRFGSFLGKNVVEMTGDVTPNMQILKTADIIITTPEKWDGLSRGWQNRTYVRDVGLIIIDEIHLLGEDRGPVLEVIVSRTNFIAHQTGIKPRIVGLSTAMANAGNLATWLGIKKVGLYNFRPSVRPVPLDVHIMGFPGKHYCPRMVSMNRPSYQAIKQFAPDSPTLIFCSSRKQTRITAADLTTYLLTDANSKRWLHCEETVIECIVDNISDPDLKHFLIFGIGIHHAGLKENDRNIVEELFVNQKIQVLIATATLAWGVNFPAHLVIIKGTEYFDGKTKRYIDMPITDVLQMMGRAGRPQYDTSGIACVFVQESKKKFYKKFLYEPFPIESNLMQVLPDHINAEIASGTITTKDKLMEYMTWTYFYCRLTENPSYYNLTDVEPAGVHQFLSDLVEAVVDLLVFGNCVIIKTEDERLFYEPTLYGQVASFYYLSYKTMVYFQKALRCDNTIVELIKIMCGSYEYETFPVRHNEDKINQQISEALSLSLNGETYESSHFKVEILIHSYLSHYEFPNQEYSVDLKSALDQSLRILQAMMDIVSSNSWLSCALKVIHVMQMLIQGQYLHEPVLLTFPHVNIYSLDNLESCLREKIKEGINLISLKHVYSKNKPCLKEALISLYSAQQTKKILQHIADLPLIHMTLIIPEIQQKITKNDIKMINLVPNQNYEFVFNLKRFGAQNLTVHAPKFPKKKDEGWFLCIGDIENDYLLEVKRFTIINQATVNLTVKTPKPGSYTFTVFLMSDSYLGLDQQYDIPVRIE